RKTEFSCMDSENNTPPPEPTPQKRTALNRALAGALLGRRQSRDGVRRIVDRIVSEVDREKGRSYGRDLLDRHLLLIAESQTKGFGEIGEQANRLWSLHEAALGILEDDLRRRDEIQRHSRMANP